MVPFGIRSSEEFRGGLRTIARIAAGCRAACEAEDKAIRPRDPRQITIGQILLLVALWALGAAAWRCNW